MFSDAEGTDRLRNRIRAKYATKSGCRLRMIFQTGSGNRADYHIKRILQAGIFMEN
ncbi:MAG: DUF6783 domain-containing protein [Blautia faecis]